MLNEPSPELFEIINSLIILHLKELSTQKLTIGDGDGCKEGGRDRERGMAW